MLIVDQKHKDFNTVFSYVKLPIDNNSFERLLLIKLIGSNFIIVQFPSRFKGISILKQLLFVSLFI